MNYVIVGSDPLVAEDLVEIVGQADPQGVAHHVSTLDSLQHMPMFPINGAILFVGLSVDEILASDVDGKFASETCQIFVIGDRPHDAPDMCEDWTFISSPFTTDTVARALMSFNAAWHSRQLASRAGTPA